VASLARTFKEGQMLMTPVMLLGTVPGMIAAMPGIELTTATAAIPLVNVALLIKAVVLGSAAPVHVLIAMASTLVCAVLAVRLAANAFASEALRFGGGSGRHWLDLFRRRRAS